MLDREKLAKEISAISSKLFPELKNEIDLAKGTLSKISSDSTFNHRSRAAKSSFLIPDWDGKLTDCTKVKDYKDNYKVISVDGSQIYPDGHMAGAGCFLINTGGSILVYGKESKASFFSEPKVFTPYDLSKEVDVSFSRDLVDLKREELELEYLCKKVDEIGTDSFCFIDGSIIFWQLEPKQPEVKKLFLDKYLQYLDELYEKKVLVAGYISMPKSKEIVNLIKLGLCRFSIADCIKCHSDFSDFPCKKVDFFIDSHISRFFLKKRGDRSTVFYSKSKIVEMYPKHLKPAFVYLDVGSEIIRLEFPYWIAQDKELVNKICSVALDQERKGLGYPVSLYEAHEQAVVKGPDREFFYHFLRKIGNKEITISPKASKKLRIGI